MSQKEADRLEVVQLIFSGQLNQTEGAERLGISTRQMRRLQRCYALKGISGLITKRRGKVSNNKLPESLISKALGLIQQHYADFGPTLAQEKLTEKHGLKISVESVRHLMIKKGLWQGQKRKKLYVHQMRERRACYGELIQIDGSPHDWFEGRAEQCCLHVFIDDATSRLMQLHFAKQECTEAYFTCMEKYLEAHGRPCSLYSDKHGIFRINTPEAKSGTGETQFGRAVRELDIELICAHSPQAKGRVEKANGTLQDRLVKEMRLRNISDINTANAFLPKFIDDYNRRFGKEARNPKNAHRPVMEDSAALQRIFSQQHQRQLSKNLELSYENVIYQIQTDTPGYNMRGGSVTVCDKKGKITLLYKGKVLPYKTFDKCNRPAKIMDSKEIARSPKKVYQKPGKNHAWRQYDLVKQLQVLKETKQKKASKPAQV